MVLFHGTPILLGSGARVAARSRGHQPGRAEFERRFAAYAPVWAGDRATAIFAADDSAFAARYLESEPKAKHERHVYQVRAVPISRHPMALVNFAFKESDPNAFAVIAREYWQPSRKWCVWEYLCAEIEVVGEERWPDVIGLDPI